MNPNTCAISKHVPHDAALPILSKLLPKSVKPLSCAASNVHIPHDVALYIVSKLTPRSLKRFSFVSKSWTLSFEDSYFMHMYRNNFVTSDCHSHYDDDTCFLLKHVDQAGNVLHLVSGENSVKLDLPPIFQENATELFTLDYDINGTLCLSTTYGNLRYDKTVLWNPTTQEFKLIPPGPKPRTKHQRLLHGFGYDHVRNDYKVLQCVYLDAHCSWEIYSLRSNSWRAFDFYISFFPSPTSVDVYVNGVCHWLYLLGGDAYGACVHCVVSFDFSNEEFLITPLPLGHASAPASLENHLVALNGYLVLISNSEHSPTNFHVSVLDQLGVRESWIKLFTIGPLPDLRRVVGIRGKGVILFRKKNGELASLDLSTLTIQVVHVKGMSPYCRQITIYKESLLPIGAINDE